MSLKSKKILGISVTIEPKETILEYIQKYLDQPAKKPLVIATPNPEQIVYAQEDAHFAKLLNGADIALPDGMGLGLALAVRRVPGVELLEDLVSLAAKRGFPVALIGGRGGVAVEALECLSRHTPGLRGWAMEPEGFDYNNYKYYNCYNCYKKIKKTKTKMVFVGLGAPKQEFFIARLASQGDSLREQGVSLPVVLMSVGGAFDMIAGRIPRAPSFVRTLGFEWLWRLVLEPWRWKRQLALVKFIWLLASKGLTLRG